MIRGNERGFTLPELIVTTITLALLAGVAALILAPANQTSERLDAERRMGVATIIQGMNRYIADSGELPMYLPDKETSIGTSGEEYDACLVTAAYLPRVPMDPQHGVVKDKDGKTLTTDVVECDDVETAYSTGYTIQKRDGKVVVSAPLASGKTFTLASAAGKTPTNSF